MMTELTLTDALTIHSPSGCHSGGMYPAPPGWMRCASVIDRYASVSDISRALPSLWWSAQFEVLSAGGRVMLGGHGVAGNAMYCSGKAYGGGHNCVLGTTPP